MVSRVQRLVPPGEPIYVAPRRSDLVTISDPLIHFLVRRPNILDRDVSVQALPAEQARTVAALRREPAEGGRPLDRSRPRRGRSRTGAGARAARARSTSTSPRRTGSTAASAPTTCWCRATASVPRVMIRALIVAAALLAGGWLAVQERAARAEVELESIAFDPGGALDAGHRRPRAGSAAHRSAPEPRPAARPLRGGRARPRRPHPRGDRRAAGATVAAEPENLEAWALLARAARTEDPALAARARARQRELAPPVPEG